MLNAPLDPTGNLGEREDVTYGEVARRALDLAAWLRKQGVTAGSFVGLVGYNSIEYVDLACGTCGNETDGPRWVVGFVAIQLLGAVTVMVNAAVKPDSMAHCLNLVKPVVILADGPCSSSITLIQDELKDCGKVRGDRLYEFTKVLTRVPGLRLVEAWCYRQRRGWLWHENHADARFSTLRA